MLRFAACQAPGLEQGVLEARKQSPAHQQPVALATVLLLLAFVLGTGSVSASLSPCNLLAVALPAVWCHTLTFIAAPLRALLEMSAAEYPVLRGGCQSSPPSPSRSQELFLHQSNTEPG